VGVNVSTKLEQFTYNNAPTPCRIA